MNRFWLTLATCAVVIFTAQWQTRGAALQAPDGSPSHRFEEIADGVYFATGTGAMTTMSNNLVIINDDHVMLVDSSVSPAAARGLVAGIKTLTDKPIKYVFNTHYHFDHAHGNQIFGDDVEIIGHEFVRSMLMSDVLAQRTNRSFTAAIPVQLEALRARVAGTTDAAERQQLEAQLVIQEAHGIAVQETRPTPPNLTYRDSLTLVKGGREVQLHFPGRGHTGGDSLVFLPEERIVFTGDFFVGSPGAGGLPYMGDGYVEEWPASLDRLRALDFEVMVPGHGAPFREREQIDHLEAYLRDFHTQVSALHAQGVSAEDATARVDLTAHAAHYGNRVENVDPRAVLRMYELFQVKMPR
ncbi:MAG: MBL fold metallo-hydrolase [Acidobacteria bacterium]|nr:MBL fold metallo-hydrolase [Acidobacteriota bacterium]